MRPKHHRPRSACRRGSRTAFIAAIALVASGMATLSPQVAQANGPDPGGTIYVADEGANAIDVFAAGANGNVAPMRRIVGPLTQLDQPGDVAVDASGDL